MCACLCTGTEGQGRRATYPHAYLPTTYLPTTYIHTYIHTCIPTYLHTYLHTYKLKTPWPCSVCGCPRLCRRRERRLIGARFGRWREERFGRTRCLTVRYSLLLSLWVDPSAEHTCVCLCSGAEDQGRSAGTRAGQGQLSAGAARTPTFNDEQVGLYSPE